MDIENNALLDCDDRVVELRSSNILFLRQKNGGQRQFDRFIGKLKIDRESTLNFQRNIELNSEFSKQNNIPYIHIIYPAKPIALRKILWAANVNVSSIVTEDHITKEVIYPLETVSEAQYYQKQGTHNTDLGYVRIIQAIFKSLDVKLPSLTPIVEKRLLKTDLAIMKGYGLVEEEVITGFEELLPHRRFFSNANALEGNSGHIEYYFNGNSLFKKRLLLFGDSFFRGSLHLLSHLFEEVIYLRCPYIIKDVADNLSPDYIWTGNAERYLVNVPDGSVNAPYFLNYFSPKFHPKKLGAEVKQVFNLLFSGRDNPKYKRWREQLTVKIPKAKLSEKGLMSIGPEDIKGKADIDFCRDTALRMEEKNFRCAIHLMRLSHGARPKGEFIQNKLEEYETKFSALTGGRSAYVRQDRVNLSS